MWAFVAAARVHDAPYWAGHTSAALLVLRSGMTVGLLTLWSCRVYVCV